MSKKRIIVEITSLVLIVSIFVGIPCIGFIREKVSNRRSVESRMQEAHELKEKIKEVKIGMSKEEVIDLLGKPRVDDGTETLTYYITEYAYFRGSSEMFGGAVVEIILEEGKVDEVISDNNKGWGGSDDSYETVNYFYYFRKAFK